MENLDKNLVRSRFRRSVESYDHAAEVQRLMAEELLELFRLATGERDISPASSNSDAAPAF